MTQIQTRLLPSSLTDSTPGGFQAALLRCVPLWALILNNFTFHYAFFILMSWLPTLYDARGADPTSMGSLKMVPYLIMGAWPP